MANRRHGKGRHFYTNGDVWEGDWEYDKKTGKGVYWRGEAKITVDGINSSWVDDKLTGKIEERGPDFVFVGSY